MSTPSPDAGGRVWMRPDLGDGLALVWDYLASAICDRASPWRTPIVATADGGADARVMVLRSANRSAARLTFFTDRRAAKCAALAAPVAAVVWDARSALQVRLRGTAVLADALATRAAWETVPVAARAIYRTITAPGTPAATPEAASAMMPGDGFTTFAVLVITVTAIDVLDLGATPHRRASFIAGDGWAGQWLTP